MTITSSATFTPTFSQEENPDDGLQTCVADLPGPLPEPALYLAVSCPIDPNPIPYPALGMMVFDGSKWAGLPGPLPHPEVAPFSPAMAFDSSSGVLLVASTVNMEPTSMEANILMRAYDGSEWSEEWLSPAFSAKGVNPSLACGLVGEGESSVFNSFLFWEDRSTTPANIRYTNLLAEVPSYNEFPNGEQPTAAIYNGDLFLSYVKDGTLVYRTYDGIVWSEENPYGAMPEPMPHPTHPSMNVGAMPEPMPDPVLYLAYEAADRIYYNTFDGTSWSTPSELENYGDLSPSGPHVCSFNNQLCMFYKSDGHVHCQECGHTNDRSISAGAKWSAPTLVQEGALFPLGTKVNFYPKGSVRYVSSSDYFYVQPGYVVADWSSLPANVQNAFLDTQQNNFALQTNAQNFQNPPMTQHAEYDAGTDWMASLFFFQFHPKDLAVGTYTFTGTWSATALANPPSYEPIYYQSTITVVIVTPVPEGGKKKVQPAKDLELTFSSVTAEGYAGARAASETLTVKAPPLPNLVGQCYDVSVTASYSGNVTVSLTYDDSNMTQQQENNLRMMQYTPIAGDIVDYGQVNILDISFIAKCFQTIPDNPNWDIAADVNLDDKINILDITQCATNFGDTAEWTNITAYLDTELNIVQGETTHFSILGIH